MKQKNRRTRRQNKRTSRQNERTRRPNKRTRRQNKIIKTLTNKSNHSMKSKCLKYIVRLQRMKNTKSKIKLMKTGKEYGTTYCLGCKDYTHNFKPQEVKMTNKVLREKSK